MTPKAAKLLEQMKRSKANWKQVDILKLYEGYGFVMIHGANHDKIKHPKHPELRTVLPRHNDLAKIYVEIAIKLIEQLTALQEGDKK